VLSVDERVSPATRKKLEEMGWKVTTAREFSHNPECIIMIEQEQGALRMVVPFHTPYSVIAW
jgi:hypothetical protein